MTGKGDALTGLEPRHKYLRQVGERGAAGSEPAGRERQPLGHQIAQRHRPHQTHHDALWHHEVGNESSTVDKLSKKRPGGKTSSYDRTPSLRQLGLHVNTVKLPLRSHAACGRDAVWTVVSSRVQHFCTWPCTGLKVAVASPRTAGRLAS